MTEVDIEDIELPLHAFDLQFHPSEPVVASSNVAGHVLFHQYNVAEGTARLVLELEAHDESCRAIRFFPDGQHMVSGSADYRVQVVDRQGNRVWRKKHRGKVNAVNVLSEQIFASGDDDGVIKVWDLRQPKSVMSFHEQGDFISDLMPDDEVKYLLATSGDGTLGVYDLRTRNGELEALSDPHDDEYLSLQIMKDGRKVVCGTQNGVISLFSWGDFGDLNDRLLGHPMSVDAMVKLDESTLLTGSSDGIIRIVSILPNRIIGVLGEHGETLFERGESFPVERLALDPSNAILASLSHDLCIKFWSTAHAYLTAEEAMKEGKGRKGMQIDEDDHDDDDDDDGDEEEDEDGPGPAPPPPAAAAAASAAAAAPSAGLRRSSRLRARSDDFFDDL
ncbi:unnamed protein product [Vitrella brassicaformis CCMP3155]|uniref:Uncharacterized protein n=1 Tax=Vitrella brassicaformis (strain CCMP3155) TaxID=1169540 RepID=A0A0G4F291_VITBC|nr:unnamed protein product [Vitrella brassicaformis CCMP3155]|mmetsp:Transcript_36942/g.92653  ORF Transcript_36942/g.92653 Transcript_36942/m.92653 type:complete len:391 (-) Transcript_36942:68-1240(-)|eukprot:CEM05746.1 unnamed protein product [Vitrella brassicaformis CCMP3155]